jgi:cyanophycinase
MKLATLCLVAVTWVTYPSDAFAQRKEPTMVLNGGNGMGLDITRPVLQLAGGSRAVVAVIIHVQEPGEMALADWRRAEPAEVLAINANELEAERQALDRATVIWFAGGFTTKLMDAIGETFLPAYIRERWRQGVIVGGDSAGGMIFPHDILISGPADLTSITAGTTKTVAGLGLLPNVLFDAHFVKRQRLNRLISLVLDYPDRLGIGADEGTALVISGRQLKVLGNSNVVVVDARNGKVTRLENGRPSHGRDLKMHVLAPGMTFDLGSAAPRP